MKPHLELKLNLDSVKNVPPVKPNFPTPIWWVFGDKQYPEENWTDFALVLVQWWSAQMIEMLQGKAEIDLSFMEGNYALHISRNGSTLTITEPDRDLYVEADFHAFLQELRQANLNLIDALRSSDLLSAEVEKLERGLAKINLLSI